MKRLCEIEGCGRVLFALGLCQAHYNRLRLKGVRGGVIGGPRARSTVMCEIHPGQRVRGLRNLCPRCYRNEWNAKVGRERIRKYEEANKANDPARRKKRIRKCNLKRTFGVTPEWFDLQLEKQNGGCAVCGATEDGRGKSLHVDHDHTTGEIRGLLCMRCNTLAGCVDNALAVQRATPELMSRVEEYVLLSGTGLKVPR
jgi:hypothetical protein